MEDTIQFVSKDEDLNKFSEYASYSSKLTKVVEIPIKSIVFIKTKYPGLIESYENITNNINSEVDIKKPVIYVNKKNKRPYIRNASLDILAFLDVWGITNSDPLIKSTSFENMFLLIKEGLVTTDSSFNEHFSKITNDSLIKDLVINSFSKVYFGKRWKVTELGEKISDLSLLNIKESNKILNVRKDMKIVKADLTEKRIEMIDKSGNKYVSNLFKITPNLARYFTEGKIITITAEKIYENDGVLSIKNIGIAPDNLESRIIRTKTISANGRKGPVNLINALYHEVNYRRSLNE